MLTTIGFIILGILLAFIIAALVLAMIGGTGIGHITDEDKRRAENRARARANRPERKKFDEFGCEEDPPTMY